VSRPETPGASAAGRVLPTATPHANSFGVVRARYETDLGFSRRRQNHGRAPSTSAIKFAIGDVIARLDPQDLKLQVQSAGG